MVDLRRDVSVSCRLKPSASMGITCADVCSWIPSEADLASKEAVVDAEKVAAGPETQSSGTGALNDKLDINIGSHQSC